MFAVIETGGKQYLVTSGTRLKVEKLDEKVGATVTFSRVLLTSDGKTTEVGTPFLSTTVEGKILDHGKADKVRIFKMKAKKRYQKTQGHRQTYTQVEITTIGGKMAPAKAAAPKAEKKEVEQKVVEKKEAPKPAAKFSAPKKEAAPKKTPATKKPAAAKKAAPKKAAK